MPMHGPIQYTTSTSAHGGGSCPCMHATAPFSTPTSTRVLQVVEDRVGVGAVHVDLGEQREGDPVLGLGEALNLTVGARLLSTELIAREASNDKALQVVTPGGSGEALWDGSRKLKGELVPKCVDWITWSPYFLYRSSKPWY